MDRLEQTGGTLGHAPPLPDDVGVVERLSGEHLDILNATTTLREAEASGSVPMAQAAVRRIRSILGSHLVLEDCLFDVLREHEEFVEFVDRLAAEHAELAAGLDAVEAGDLSATRDLIGRLRDHMDNEDDGVFVAAEVELGAEGWQRVRDLYASRVG